MTMSGPAGEFYKECECAPYQRLGLGEPIGVVQQSSKVVEAERNIGMVRHQALFVDGERTPHQRLSLGFGVEKFNKRLL